ncbi:MAG: ATP-binding protein [Euryarchaeota archaeon]|nr:ATP-binding protein [Euryarchaeota archaeon]
MKHEHKNGGNRQHLSLSWKIILLTMIPFLMVLISLSALTIHDKTQNERDLVLNRIDSYVNLLESGDLSFESVRQKEKLEKMFDERVISSELIGRGGSVVYAAGNPEHEVDSELIENAFGGFTVTYTTRHETPVLISLYPIIVEETVVGVLHLELSFERSNERIKRYTFFILLLNAYGLVASFLLVRFLSQRIVINRLEALTDMSSEIGKGNLQHRLDIRSNDELGILASAFNDMAGELGERKRQLDEERSKVLDKVEELEEQITRRETAEGELKRTVTDLRRSNAELEQFAYVASHDLQEPLRMVSSYMQLLSRRYVGKLDSDADDFIGFAVDGAKRMQVLINDLLVYSRVGTRGKPFEPTNCEDVLNQVLSNLEVAIDESGAVFTHDLLPTVAADASQLTQLFQNLIGNAIKFHGDDPPLVHVAAERKGDEWEFSVTDNGIGIEPEYFERIFVIFQRLHGREEYSGTGIGLAVCKKIVERHGGRMWVESEQGRGATFCFTIPAKGGEQR